MDTTERSNYLFDLAYRNAMGDATRRTNVEAGSKKIFLDTNKPNSRKAKNLIREYIDENFKGEHICFYETASSVVKLLSFIDDKNTFFDFGNAQKLINMTAKYLFIMLYNSDDIDLRSKFTHFHCPMDRIMINTVTRKYSKYLNSISNAKEKENKEKNLYIKVAENGKPCKESTGECSKKWGKVAWSDLNEDTKYVYEKYQKMVCILCKEAEKEAIIPLEFDLKYWKP